MKLRRFRGIAKVLIGLVSVIVSVIPPIDAVLAIFGIVAGFVVIESGLVDL